MKKLHYLTLAVLASVFSACQIGPEEPEALFASQETLLKAVIESQASTRTGLGPAEEGVSEVQWKFGDQIGVFTDTDDQLHPFTLTGGVGSRTATFSGYGSGNNYLAVYPYSDGLVRNGETVQLDLPVEQDYAEGSFGNGAYPMVAVSNFSELPFVGLASILKISLKGRQSVTRIVFRSNDPSVKVSGPATVSLAQPAEPVLTMSSKGADSVILNVGSAALDPVTEKAFFLTLPAQTYKGGFIVRIYTPTGYMDKRYNSDFKMERAQIHAATPVMLKLDYGAEPSEVLDGAGTQKDPFQISSLGDILLLQGRVNTEGATIQNADGVEAIASSASFVLTSDLDLSPLCGRSKGKSWTPIGDMSTNENWVFTGTFDGGGHVITGLYIEESKSQQGFFGNLQGTVRNLTVHGTVNGRNYCGILAGYVRSALVENCTSKGSVTSDSETGGLLGYVNYATLNYCRNEAEVNGGWATGGIMGYADFCPAISHCTNDGTVHGQQSCGGIAGYMNGAKIFDCTNTGSVTGSSLYAGGIGGYLWQGSKIYNCSNYGPVKAKDYAGGLAGFVSCDATLYQGPATVANCLSLGKVEITNGQYAGSLAAYIGKGEYETLSPSESETSAWVKNSYWQPSLCGDLPDTGGGTGIADGNFALTEAQMKGTPCDVILYNAADGTGYNRLIDALNAGAVQWSKNTPVLGGDTRDHFPLSGWEYKSSNSYPVQTDLEAQMPGQAKPVFLLSEKTFECNVKGGTFQVEVTSSQGYTVGRSVDWITEESVQTPDGRPHTHIHTFKVAVNRSSQARNTVIYFTNEAGTVLNFKVSQKAPFLTVSMTEAIFTEDGGSKRIIVSSSLDWTVTSSSDWFRVAPKSGEGDGALSVIVEPNRQVTARSSSFTVAARDGSFTHVISVIQSGKTASDGTEMWKEKPFYHKSLAMRFTATWCSWCPYMNAAITRAQELYPDKILHLALHSGGSDLEFGPASTLMSLYRTNAFPTGIVDGRINVPNSTDTDGAAAQFIDVSKETESTYGTVSGMAVRSVCSGQLVTIDVDAYFKVAGEYKMTVLLVEDGIIHEQTNGGTNYRHDHVARVSATDITGDAFTIGSDLTKRAFHFSVAVPEEDKIENMRVVAYIQKTFGSAPKIQSDDYGDYYVDNCVDAPVGGSVKLALVGGGGGDSGGGNEEIIPGDEIK